MTKVNGPSQIKGFFCLALYRRSLPTLSSPITSWFLVFAEESEAVEQLRDEIWVLALGLGQVTYLLILFTGKTGVICTVSPKWVTVWTVLSVVSDGWRGHCKKSAIISY